MTPTTLAELTTLRVGGPIGRLVDAESEAELIEAVSAADAAGTPVLVLGAGSNVLAHDHGFDGVVIRDARRTVEVQDDGACGGVSVTAAAGTPWDSLVDRAVSEGWMGIEALSGIPGSAGATPVQNVGAYGQEVSDSISVVRTWDRDERRVRSFARVDCEFGYRDSRFKRSMERGGRWHPTPRFVVLEVSMQLRFGTISAPIAYAQLAEALGVAVGDKAPLAQVRAAVLALRASKGMVLDPADHDTWSAGSFFTNPVLSADVAARLPDGAPAYPAGSGAPHGTVKTSAAWLIENAGFAKGYGLAAGANATLSTKHTLALTNRGGATASEVRELARAVRAGVHRKFGIELEPEPVVLGEPL